MTLGLVLSASAANVGEKIGEAVYTDITAYINNYPIRSYNIDGYTAVVAEDLSAYGFNVAWHGGNRTLTVTRGTSTDIIYNTSVTKAPASRVGTKALDVLATDIRTYVGDNEVAGRNVGGFTIIDFEALSVYGTCVYDNEKRALFLTLEGLPVAEYQPVQEIDPVQNSEALDSISASLSLLAFLSDPSGNSLPLVFDGKLEMSMLTKTLHFSFSASSAGESASTDMYVDMTGTTATMYMFVPEASAWAKMTFPITDVNTLPTGASMELFDASDIADEAPFIGTETVKDKQYNVYSLELPLSDIAGAHANGVDLNGKTIEIEIYIDPDTNMFSMAYVDLAEYLNLLLPMYTQENVSFSTAAVAISIDSFNTCNDLAVPANIKATAVSID